MNFSFLILEFLKQQGNAPVPCFGTFYLKNSNALLDAEGKNILPPGEKVAFKTDVLPGDTGFAQFIATQKNIPLIDAENEIKKQVNFWNTTLEKEGKVGVENVGTFFLDDSKIHFTGNRTQNLSPDFYGLEQISLSEIKNVIPSIKTDPSNSYHFSKSLYWTIPLILGILGLTYFGISQPEKIFGKRSFGDGLEKKLVKKIAKDSIKKDSATLVNPILDSAKTDSLKPAVIGAKTPARKWSSKKYSKSKWKKSRKRQNR